ncbi:MAG: DUF1800 domain-containing protein [Vicinamibacteria bacterium]|jgi:uncharacterized protein (DUF1800 family)|nr:DUF1800 domain-containing protein [Vicinamibacteria bacterium]MBP9944870.1 DUF1800 domain-containing protein [Vicinamibacteria bacterium]
MEAVSQFRPAAKDANKAVVHFLNRAGFGPRPGQISRVVNKGLGRYLEEQLNPRPDPPLAAQLLRFKSLKYSVATLLDIYHGRRAFGRGMPLVVEELQTAKVVRAIEAQNQLEEVLVDFWFNHFNVNLQHQFVRQSIIPYERDAIRPHVFGKFADLLRATARHPAMLFYLDNYLSRRNSTTNGKVARGLNENYGRELLELHTLGVDGGYTQEDVIAAARCFTGWSIDDLKTKGRFVFRPADHDEGPKRVFGLEVPAGGGVEDGDRVLTYLAAHPATARFVCFKLARRFVADDPPPSLVDTCARTFIETGGDLRSVTRTLFTSAEFRAAADQPRYRTPFLYLVAALRATGARVESAEPGLIWHLDKMGMRPYFCTPPTGWSDRGRDWQSSAHVYRLNFALDLANDTIRGVQVRLAPRLAAARYDAGSSVSIAAFFNREVFGGGLSERTMGAAKGLTKGHPGTVAKVAGLILSSPEMQSN